MALTVVFAAVSLSGTLDRLQHAPGAPVHHEHTALSQHTAEIDHADHHADAHDDESDTSPDHMAGAHHHHAEGGAGLAALPPGAPPVMLTASAPQGWEGFEHDIGLYSPGPERPPKYLMMDA